MLCSGWLSRTFNAPLVEITNTLLLAYGAMLVAEAGLHVSDRIRLSVGLAAELRGAIDAFRSYVVENVLFESLPGFEGGDAFQVEPGGGDGTVIHFAKGHGAQRVARSRPDRVPPRQ